MARKLPWLVDSAQKSKGLLASRGKTAPKPNEDRSVGGDDGAEGRGRAQARPSREGRNASSSPPPAPLEVEYMRPGADADDAWRMVEDEFFVTSSEFTRHLHHAELQRQKQLAKVRNQTAVNAITQSTLDRDRAGAATSRTASIMRQDGAKPVDDHKDRNNGDDDPWLRDPRLARLMSSKQRKPQHTKIRNTQSTSRAALGFSKGQPSPPKRCKYTAKPDGFHEKDAGGTRSDAKSADHEYDSDDLDAPSQPESNQEYVSTAKSALMSTSTRDGKSNILVGDKVRSRETERRTADLRDNAVATSHLARTYESEDKHDDDDDDDDDEQDGLFGLFASRKRKHVDTKQTRQATESGTEKRPPHGIKHEDEIPTFLV